MTSDEAKVIFLAWQEYVEVADKFFKLMITPPPSFLPYPLGLIEEALNITAKEHFDSGNRKAAKTIQDTMASYLSGYYLSDHSNELSDEKALEKMATTLRLILDSPPLKATVLKNLKSSQESWMALRRDANFS